MDEQNLDFEAYDDEFENAEEAYISSPPEAFYHALRNALYQLKHQPVETPNLH